MKLLPLPPDKNWYRSQQKAKTAMCRWLSEFHLAPCFASVPAESLATRVPATEFHSTFPMAAELFRSLT
jgi:hypothetical protein